MYDQLEKEDCFTFVTLAPGQRVVGPIAQTIFENDDMVVTRDGATCTYATFPVLASQYKLTYTAGVQGVTVTFGADAAGGEDVVVERDIDAFRLAQFSTTGALPIGGLNDEHNFLAAAIQSASRWEVYMRSILRLPLGSDVDPIPLVPNTVIFIDENGQPTGLTLQQLADLIAGVSISPGAFADLFEQVVEGNGIDIDRVDDETVRLTPDLGGDLLLLEGDQQSGQGGGGSIAGLTLEDVMDYLGSSGLVQGTGTTIAYNDVAGTITFTSTATGLNQEQVEDIIAQMLGEVPPISAVYDDASGTYTFSLDPNGLSPIDSVVVPLCADDVVLANGMTRTFRAPYGITVLAAYGSVKTAQTGGAVVRFDIEESGASIFGANKITVGNGLKTSIGGTAPDYNDTSIAGDAELVFKCTQVGDGTAKGGVVRLVFRRQT